MLRSCGLSRGTVELWRIIRHCERPQPNMVRDAKLSAAISSGDFLGGYSGLLRIAHHGADELNKSCGDAEQNSGKIQPCGMQPAVKDGSGEPSRYESRGQDKSQLAISGKLQPEFLLLLGCPIVFLVVGWSWGRHAGAAMILSHKVARPDSTQCVSLATPGFCTIPRAQFTSWMKLSGMIPM